MEKHLTVFTTQILLSISFWLLYNIKFLLTLPKVKLYALACGCTMKSCILQYTRNNFTISIWNLKTKIINAPHLYILFSITNLQIPGIQEIFIPLLTKGKYFSYLGVFPHQRGKEQQKLNFLRKLKRAHRLLTNFYWSAPTECPDQLLFGSPAA